MTVLDLNSRELMDGFFAMNGMTKKADEIMKVLENKGNLTDSRMKEFLVSEVKMLPCKAETLLDFLAVTGDRAELIDALGIYRGIEKSYDTALDRLKSDL